AAVAIAQGDPDAGVTEADDIRLVISVQIRKITGVQGDSPALVIVESGENELRATAARDGRPDTVVAESNDIGFSISGQVSRKAWLLFDAPALVVAQIVDDQLRRLKAAVAIAQRDPRAVVAEADNVSFAVTGYIGEKARVLIDAPAVVIAQIGNDESHGLEGA